MMTTDEQVKEQYDNHRLTNESENNKHEWSTGDSIKWWRKFEHWLFKIMTIDWQVMMLYDDDTLTSDSAIW